MRWYVVVLSLAIIACSAPAKTPAAAAPLTAPQIIARMVATYASATSYADRGTSTSRYSATESDTTTFTTAFVRPDRFRFEFRDDGKAAQAYVIWRDGKHVYSTWYVRPGEVSDDPDLATPLAAATGVSGGLAAFIPPLVFGDPEPFLGTLNELAITGDAVIGGHPCWLVAGSRASFRMTLAIDQKQFVIRRIMLASKVEQPGAAALELAQTIELEPRLDAPLAATELAGPSIANLTVKKRDVPKWVGILFEERTNRIRQVLANSPAARAGLRSGDQVVALGSTPVMSAHEVIRAVQDRDIGDTLEVVLERGGRRVTITVGIEARPDLEQLQHRKLTKQAAPPFSLQTLTGTTVTLADLKGKVVVIDFWATWCKPCVSAFPALKLWHHELGPKGLVIVGITDDDVDAVRATVAEHKLPHTIALDADHVAWADYLIQGLPTTVIVDKTGVVRYVSVGAGDEAMIEATIKKLLQ